VSIARSTELSFFARYKHFFPLHEQRYRRDNRSTQRRFFETTAKKTSDQNPTLARMSDFSPIVCV
jgi:hypothetical protein